LKKIRTIKELLEIDIEFLRRNSVFNSDLITDKNDNRSILIFDLSFNFLNLFDQFLVRLFNSKPMHLEFRTSKINSTKLDEFIKLIVTEYGKDENNQSAEDWNQMKSMAWWFKNENHEKTYDDFENTDETYYGLMINESADKKIQFAILSYNTIDSKFERENWLQQ